MADVPQAAKNIKARPDFMAPGPVMRLTDKGVELEKDEAHEVGNRVYYKSSKILGKLFRSVDENRFFTKMKDGFEASRAGNGSECLMNKLARYVDRESHGVQWKHHRQFAVEIRE